MYAELHCKTNFSFLEGAAHADELFLRAQQLGYAALAVTDRESLSGIVRAHTAAKETGVKLIVGVELRPLDAPPLVVWVTDRAAYGRLSRLITVGRRRAPKGECELYLDDIAEHSAGLLAGIPAICADPLSGWGTLNSLDDLGRYREIFAAGTYLLAELFLGPDDERQLERLKRHANHTGLPLVAAGDVHYHAPDRMLLYDLLTAIRNGMTVADVGQQRFTNAERHLREIEQIKMIFARAPAAVHRTTEIAERCHFSLDELQYEYPEVMWKAVACLPVPQAY